VAEVALAVQLAEPATDDTLTLGHYWPKIQARYPRLEPQPPLPPMAEVFGAGPPTINFQLFSASPAGRYWFLSGNGEELVQVQPDRFAYNWRKEGVAEPESPHYPRYEQLRERFFDVYSAFVDTCEAEGRSVKPTWCEITYINHIDLPRDSAIPDLATVFRRVQMTPLPGLDSPEDTTLSERYVLRDAAGEPYGRFYVTATPAYRIENQAPLMALTFVVRGMAKSPDTLGVIGLLDEGRDLIVNSFKRLTTDAMHEEWGLKDVD
jgi:uncharacterized protein (TIGR04255 family)